MWRAARFACPLAFALVILLAGLTSSYSVAKVPGRMIAQDRQSGDRVTAAVSVTARHPKAIYFRVTASPKQSIKTSYLLTCVIGYASRRSSVKVTGRTPYVRKMKMKYRNPDVCYVIASSHVRNTGTVKIQVFSKK